MTARRTVAIAAVLGAGMVSAEARPPHPHRLTPSTICTDTMGTKQAPAGMCQIVINPNPMAFSGNVGSTSTQNYDVTNATGKTLQSWTFTITTTGGPGTFALGAPCPGSPTTCNTTTVVVDGDTYPLPQPFVECTLTGPGSVLGMLTVTGTTAAPATMYTAVAAVTCTGGTAASPEIDWSPPSFDLQSPVGTPITAQLDVRNQGTADLHFQLHKSGTGPFGDWSFPCETAPCTVTPVQMHRVVDVTFTPMAVFDRSIDIVMTSDDADEGTVTIPAGGTGLGAVISADRMSIVFGDIPINQTSATQTINVLDTGNTPVGVTAAVGANPVFVDVPAGQGTVTIPNGGSHPWGVACHPTAAGMQTSTWVATAPTAVGARMLTVDLHCNGIDSSVLLSPALIDFGRVRVGQDGMQVPVIIQNSPGGGSVAVGTPTLSATDQFFAVGPVPVSSLAAGQMTSFTVDYHPGQQGMNSAEIRDILPDEPGRVIQVQGRGVIADYVVSPDPLDLGTACVGATVTDQVQLIAIQDGVLGVDMPSLMDGSQFAMAPVMPTAFPAMLDPLTADHTLVTEVRVTALPGPISDQLILPTDKTPGDHAVVDISLNGIVDGLAASPGMVEFGRLPLGSDAGGHDITVQLCGALPTSVGAMFEGDTALGLLGPPMAPVGAAQSHPWSIRMSTATAGDFHATLHLVPSGAIAPVDIPIHGSVGDLGEPDDLGHTNYYACGCNTETGGAGTLLIVLVLAFPRRRRSARRAA